MLKNLTVVDMGIDLGDIKVSKMCSDKVFGNFYAIGTNKQWLEIRITKSGRIKPFGVHKGKHPYFTKKEFNGYA